MNRLRQVFADVQAKHHKVLVPYITAGYPDVATSVEILTRLDPARLGCVELGIPFSDPIADGPVIQTSVSRALESGFKLDPLLAALTAARDRIRVPLIAMLSYSIVFRRTPAEFVQRARAAGLDGLLVPDLAFEEAEELAALCRQHDLPLVMMIAPTTAPARRSRIAALSEPWIYYQSLAGVTGERAGLPPDLAAHVAELRGQTGKPICVGFGIARPEHVAAVCAVADGAIVGSAIVRRMNDAVDAGLKGAALAIPLTAFIAELAAAVPR